MAQLSAQQSQTGLVGGSGGGDDARRVRSLASNVDVNCCAVCQGAGKIVRPPRLPAAAPARPLAPQHPAAAATRIPTCPTHAPIHPPAPTRTATHPNRSRSTTSGGWSAPAGSATATA